MFGCNWDAPKLQMVSTIILIDTLSCPLLLNNATSYILHYFTFVGSVIHVYKHVGLKEELRT